MTADAPKFSIYHIALVFDDDNRPQHDRGQIGIGAFDCILSTSTTMVSYLGNRVFALLAYSSDGVD